MSKTRDPDGRSGNATVGYGRPPTATQFKKGQSGNPRGRPRKSETAQAPSDHWGISLHATGRIAYERVNVTLNGKQTTIPAIEAVHRRQINDAMKGGNRLLQRDVIARADAYEREQLTREVERFEDLKEKKARGEALIAQAKSRGLPEPVLLPHPDDIIIDDEAITATVDGPEIRSQLVLCNFMVAVRDHFVIRAAYQRLFPPLFRPFTEDHFKALRIGADALNQGLCNRLHWGPYGFWSAMRPYDKKGYRFLEADLENSLASIDQMWANEPTLEPLRRQRRVVKFMTELLDFKSRKRERLAWQQQYSEMREVFRLAFGDKAISHWPKRMPTISYEQGIALGERLSPEDRAMSDRIVAVFAQNGSADKAG